MSSTLEGGCLCGAVRYRLELPAIDAAYCHCRLCQRSSGAPVLAYVSVSIDAFEYTQGEPTIFHSSSHSQREFCSVCATQLVFRKSHDASVVDVTIPSLDDPERATPEFHIWRSSRLDWFDTADALPRYDRQEPGAPEQ